MRESDLYEPVKIFFESMGYKVNGEVKGCDMTAVKGDQMIIVEFKTRFSLKLVYQAIDRQKMTADVYICLPRPEKPSRKAQCNMMRLIKRLSLGLMTVALDSPMKTVDILAYPGDAPVRKDKRKTAGLLKEAAGRSIDLNRGGSQNSKIMTAYREKSIKIACLLEVAGAVSLATLAKQYGLGKDAGALLQRNAYGWFDRVCKGVYALSPDGRQALKDEAYAPLVQYYRIIEGNDKDES